MQQQVQLKPRQASLNGKVAASRGVLTAARPGRRMNIRCATSDYSIKIKGDMRRVYKYVSDLTNRPSWDSATLEAVTIKGRSQIGVGTSFALVQTPLPTVKIPVTYTITEFLPPKKLVLTGQAETYKAKKVFVFMEHPNQPQQTIVRQMFEVVMTDWKAMIPMLEGQLAKKEQTAFKNLETLLNGSKSPLQNIMLTQEEMKASRAPSSPSNGVKQQGWSLGSVFNNILSGSPSSSNGNGVAGGPSEEDVNFSGAQFEGPTATAVRVEIVSDALGYYRLLGLQPSEKTTSEEIKSAFRRAAMAVHPDRMVGADEKVKQAAQLQFQILQAAYETLKDPVKRNLYDKGQMMSVVE